MSSTGASLAEVAADPPSQDQLRRLLIPDIEDLVTNFCDDQEFLLRARQRCLIGRTAAADKLIVRIDGLLALIDERVGGANKLESQWGWWAICGMLALAVPVGIFQGIGHDVWQATRHLLAKVFGF